MALEKSRQQFWRTWIALGKQLAQTLSQNKGLNKKGQMGIQMFLAMLDQFEDSTRPR